MTESLSRGRADYVARVVGAVVAVQEELDQALGELVHFDVAAGQGHVRVLRDRVAEVQDAFEALDAFDRV